MYVQWSQSLTEGHSVFALLERFPRLLTQLYILPIVASKLVAARLQHHAGPIAVAIQSSASLSRHDRANKQSSILLNLKAEV